MKQKPKTKAAPKTKAIKLESKWFDLGIGQISTIPVLSPVQSSLIEQLGPPRWTKQEQEAAPEERRTRLVVDCLRPGKWKTFDDGKGHLGFWDCTEETCMEIVRVFNEQKALPDPIEHNFTWTHGNPEETGAEVESKEIIGKIDQLIWSQGRIWATIYLNQAEAQDFKNKSYPVSVRVWSNWTDGTGRMWPISLLHIALVDHPVVPGQVGWMDLSISYNRVYGPSKKGKKMAFTLAPTVEAINKLLPGNLSLPETISEENFDETLAMVMEMVASANEPAPADSSTPSTDPATDPGLPASLGNSQLGQALANLCNMVKAQSGQLADLGLRIASMEQGQGASAQAAFKNKLTAMASEGKIDAALIGPLQNLGKANGWNLSCLSPYEGQPGRDLGNRSRRLASGSAPNVDLLPGGEEPLTEAEQAQARKMLGVRS